MIDSHAHDWGNSSTEVLIGLRGSTLKTVHYSTKSCCLGKRWKSCRLRDVFPSDGNRNWSLLLVAVLGASWWVTGWLCLDLLWISSLGLGLSDLNADSDVHVVHYYASLCVSFIVDCQGPWPCLIVLLYSFHWSIEVWVICEFIKISKCALCQNLVAPNKKKSNLVIVKRWYQ